MEFSVWCLACGDGRMKGRIFQCVNGLVDGSIE